MKATTQELCNKFYTKLRRLNNPYLLEELEDSKELIINTFEQISKSGKVLLSFNDTIFPGFTYYILRQSGRPITIGRLSEMLYMSWGNVSKAYGKIKKQYGLKKLLPFNTKSPLERAMNNLGIVSEEFRLKTKLLLEEFDCQIRDVCNISIRPSVKVAGILYTSYMINQDLVGEQIFTKRAIAYVCNCSEPAVRESYIRIMKELGLDKSLYKNNRRNKKKEVDW